MIRKKKILSHYIEQKKLLIFIHFQVINFFKLSHKPLSKISTFNFYLTIPCDARKKFAYMYSVL